MSVHLETVRGQCSPVHCIAAIFFSSMKRVQLNKGWHLSFHRKHCISLISLLFWVVGFLFCCVLFLVFPVFIWILLGYILKYFLLSYKQRWISSFIHKLTKNRHVSGFKTLEAVDIAVTVTYKHTLWTQSRDITDNLVF